MTMNRNVESLGISILLTALVAYGPLSTDLYLPSLPAMTQAFDTTVSRVQLTLSAFMLGFAVAQLVYGSLSDRFGRRPVLLGGLVIYVLASIVCIFASTIEALTLWRFFQALGACAGPVLGRAIVRDIYGHDRAARALSFMASGMALVPAVAPILGGWLHALFGWRTNFAAMAGFGALVLVSTWLLLTETNRRMDPSATRPSRILGNFGILLRDRQFVGFALALAFAFGALFSVISGLSFVVIDILGIAPERFGYVFMTVVAGFISGTLISAGIGRRTGIRMLVLLGALMGTGAGAVMAALAWSGVETLWAVALPAALVFTAAGLVMPNAMAGAIGPFPAMAGAASSLLGFLQMTLAAFAGYLVGALHDGTTRPMAMMVLVMCSLTLLVHLLLIRNRNVVAPGAEDTQVDIEA